MALDWPSGRLYILIKNTISSQILKLKVYFDIRFHLLKLKMFGFYIHVLNFYVHWMKKPKFLQNCNFIFRSLYNVFGACLFVCLFLNRTSNFSANWRLLPLPVTGLQIETYMYAKLLRFLAVRVLLRATLTVTRDLRF
jgi:hypothetical protein